MIDENNPVRVIDAFIDHLDVAELEITHAQPAATGSPPMIRELFLNYISMVTLAASVPAGNLWSNGDAISSYSIS